MEYLKFAIFAPQAKFGINFSSFGTEASYNQTKKILFEWRASENNKKHTIVVHDWIIVTYEFYYVIFSLTSPKDLIKE